MGMLKGLANLKSNSEGAELVTNINMFQKFIDLSFKIRVDIYIFTSL